MDATPRRPDAVRWPRLSDAEPVTKTELTAFIRQIIPQANDVQQARHLAAQQGWYVVVRHAERRWRGGRPGRRLQIGELGNAYPGYRPDRRARVGERRLERLKASYGHRCAVAIPRKANPTCVGRRR
jgi:hypothetical protein